MSANPFTFYLDTHIAGAVAEQLRRRGVRVIRCEEVHLETAKDIEHLTYAAENGLTLVTQDYDFRILGEAWQQEGRDFSGIIILPRHLQGEAQISYAVRELGVLYEMIVEGAGTLEDDIMNRVIWL